MIGWILQNGVTAAALAVLVWAVCRWGRLGPAARHALWLLVLIKLVMPPVATWPWAVANPAARVQAADGREMGTAELLRSLLRDEQIGGARRDAAKGGNAAAISISTPGPVASTRLPCRSSPARRRNVSGLVAQARDCSAHQHSRASTRLPSRLVQLPAPGAPFAEKGRLSPSLGLRPRVYCTPSHGRICSALQALQQVHKSSR